MSQNGKSGLGLKSGVGEQALMFGLIEMLVSGAEMFAGEAKGRPMDFVLFVRSGGDTATREFREG